MSEENPYRRPCRSNKFMIMQIYERLRLHVVLRMWLHRNIDLRIAMSLVLYKSY